MNEKLTRNTKIHFIKNDGTFTLKVKKITLQGIITKVDDGVFDFAFQAFGKKRIGTFLLSDLKSVQRSKPLPSGSITSRITRLIW